jgi:hypothetical protein
MTNTTGYIAIMPPGGWKVRITYDPGTEKEVTVFSDVVMWAITTNNNVVPLIRDDTDQNLIDVVTWTHTEEGAGVTWTLWTDAEYREAQEEEARGAH